MKCNNFKYYLLVLLLAALSNNSNGVIPWKIYPSLNFYIDLSDTYGGGCLFSGDIELIHSLYGTNISFGHFQSQATYILKIPVPEINGTLNIPFDEISTMQIISCSGLLIPVQKKRFMVSFLIGGCYNRSKSLLLNGFEYNYDLNEKKFTYLIKDYRLNKENHFGYQLGINLSYYLLPKIGIQINSRIQDLFHGGSFFFVGGGLCFNL